MILTCSSCKITSPPNLAGAWLHQYHLYWRTLSFQTNLFLFYSIEDYISYVGQDLLLLCPDCYMIKNIIE
jgi:hypothetical protein